MVWIWIEYTLKWFDYITILIERSNFLLKYVDYII